MKLAGYIRVSTLDQVEHGQGLDIQRAELTKWAEKNGHTLADIYSDEGVSGKNGLADRPGLADALGSIRFNGNEGLVTLSLDRLARTLTVQEGALASIWKAGGTVFTVEQGEIPQDDPDDPTRTMVRQIMGAVSQFEAATVKRRLRKGRDHKRASGGFAGGKVPYGFTNVDAELVPEPAEQEAIEVMKDLRKGGHSYRAIVTALTGLNIPPKSGKQWHPGTVRRILEAQS